VVRYPHGIEHLAEEPNSIPVYSATAGLAPFPWTARPIKHEDRLNVEAKELAESEKDLFLDGFAAGSSAMTVSFNTIRKGMEDWFHLVM